MISEQRAPGISIISLETLIFLAGEVLNPTTRELDANHFNGRG